MAFKKATRKALKRALREQQSLKRAQHGLLSHFEGLLKAL
jgi:hypothetical protein